MIFLAHTLFLIIFKRLFVFNTKSKHAHKRHSLKMETESQHISTYFFPKGKLVLKHLKNIPSKYRQTIKFIIEQLPSHLETVSTNTISKEHLTQLDRLLKKHYKVIRIPPKELCDAISSLITFLRSNATLGALRQKDRHVKEQLGVMTLLEYGLVYPRYYGLS